MTACRIIQRNTSISIRLIRAAIADWHGGTMFTITLSR